MIKLVSLLIFVIAFALSWLTFNSHSGIGIDIHAGIQSKLAMMIEDTLKTKKPNAIDFVLTKMHTEKIDDNKIKAAFSYKYNEKLEEKELAQQMISGETILSRTASEDPNIQKWIVQSIKTGASKIEFKEGTVITSDGKGLDHDQAIESNEEKKTE